METMKYTGLIFLLVGIFVSASYSQHEENSKGKKQFLYLLRLEKAMLDFAAWTPEKSKIVQEHFAYLQKLFADGKLILAGRTEVENEKTFGIVILEADNLEEATSIAQNDSGVKGKIMNLEVYPYRVALIKEGSVK